MLLIDLKSAVKNFRGQGVFTTINIIGLAVCFACILLLTQYLRQETSYDRFHSASDRLYRAWIHEDHGGGRTITDISTPIILAPTLTENFPEIEQVVRVDKVNIQFRSGDDVTEETLHLVDQNFLDSFSFEWLAGNSETALSDIHNIVLTPALVEKYFGSEPPLGQTLELNIGDNFESFTVAGVIAPPPQASTLQFQVLIPFSERYYGDAATSWFNVTVETYLLLAQGVDAGILESSINDLMVRALGERYPDGHYEVHLQPMPSIHLDTSIRAGMEPLGDPVALILVASAAVLLLVIASVNYTTISLGGIARRVKEVGLRRTLGASGANIWQQFCVEAIVVCCLAMLLGYALAEIYLPIFNRLAATSLSLDMGVELFILMSGIVALFCLVTGSMPALVLSRFKPANLLGDRLTFDSDKSLLMKGLIAFQFSLAIMMLVSSVAVALQMRYIDSKDLGFDKENLMVVSVPGGFTEALQLADRFMVEVRDLAFVEGVSRISAPPGDGIMQMSYTDDQGIFRSFDVYLTGPDLFSVMGMNLIEGRAFRQDSELDANGSSLIVNEAFVREYGWTQGVGNRLPGREFPDHDIVGVVRDANFRPLVDEVPPTAYAVTFRQMSEGISDTVSYSSLAPEVLVRLDSTPLLQALPALEAAWDGIQSGSSFEFYMLEQELAAQYAQQANFQEIVSSASTLAIMVAAMGLFAMALLVANRRRKEIGVRKVMGSSIWSITVLLTNDFSKLVLFSNIIAWPVAYFAMNSWLENFAFRIDLTPMIFIGSGLIALCIAWVTVGGTAAKAASRKPVLALRYE